MKKKLLAFLLACVLLLPCLIVTSAASGETKTYTHNFDSGITQSGSANGTVATSSSGSDCFLGDSGKGLSLKANTTGSTRHTALTTFQEGGVMAPGTYTVTLYVRHNPASSSDWVTGHEGTNPKTTKETKTEAALILYDKGMTDSQITESNGLVTIKLFPKTTDGIAFSKVTPEQSASSANKTWYLYSATFTLTAPCDSFSFWVLGDGITDTQTWYAYCDNMTITGTPAPEAEGATFRGVQESSVSDAGKFNARFVASVSSASYAEAGFDVSCNLNGTEKATRTFAADAVCNKLLARDGDGILLTYDASDWGATHLFALTFANIPAEGTVTFTVTPYVKDAAGNKTPTAKAYTVTYLNGVFQSIA